MNESIKPSQQSFVDGALWMVALRWMQRLIGLVSTVILARLLTPADFGIVALALIVVGLIEILSVTAVDLAVIREQNASREHYDTAWTIQIIQAAIIAILLVITAPYASIYFDEPAIKDVIYLLAFSFFVSGFRNIATLDFRKNLNFSKDFYFHLYKKVFSFIFIVGLAFILENYWALIFGMLATALIEIILSYKMHEFRPRISFSRIREIWSFSQWMLLSRIGYFFNQKTDQFLIGGTSNIETMGVYHISTEIATMPTSEVAMPLRRAFFPNFSKITHSPEEFNNSILKALGFLSIAIFAAGTGMSVIAEDFVLLVLGDKWLGTIPLVQILAVFGIAAALSTSMEVLLLVTGRGDLSTIESWLKLSVLVPVIWYAVHFSDIQDVAMARTAVAILFVPIMIYLITRATPVKFLSVLQVMWRPFISSLIMYYIVKACHIDNLSIVSARAAFDIVIGIVSFSASIFILWIMSGRVPGAESDLYTYLAALIKKYKVFR